jgi:hypothetical protein
VDVWSCRYTGNGVSKHQEWNLFGSQEVNKGNPLQTIRMKPNIQTLAVIESPTIVNV